MSFKVESGHLGSRDCLMKKLYSCIMGNVGSYVGGALGNQLLTLDPPLRALPVVWNGTYTSSLLSGWSHVSCGDSKEPPFVRLV